MQFERWATVNLDQGEPAVLDLGPTLYRGDTNPLKVGVRLVNSQGPVTVEGSAAARAVDARGQIYAPIPSGEDDNEAWCEIPQAVLAWPGKIDIFLRVAGSTSTAVTLHAIGTVQDTGDGEILNPGEPIPDVEDLQAAATAANQAAADAEAAIAALAEVATAAETREYLGM